MRSLYRLYCLLAPLSFLLIAQIALCQNYGPRFRFDNQDNGNGEDLPETPQQRQNDLHWGFHEALMLARMVSVTFNPCEPVFLRYFKRADADFVRDVFYTIANIPLGGLPPNLQDFNAFNQFVSGFGQNAVNPKFDQLSISINDNSAIGEYTPLCATVPGFQAYFDQKYDTLGDLGFISVCDYAFNFPSLADIENPPSWARDPTTGAPEPGFGCDGLLDHDNDYMLSLSGIMLHEIFHWPYLLRDIPGYDTYISLYQDDQLAIQDWDGPFPTDGYGPYHAMQINNLQPQQSSSGWPSLNNADSYLYYALSKWWQFKCRRTFGPAVDEDDGHRREYPRY
ncbi:uncharacterized protein PV07_00033 [Cladophialophora immunda]|uniref:Lysine-specific metallo-endopeptidase domain-containing protein n=1 Tax=Cladophialophora immunda TaxID=569365 RepID=A0A0D2B6F1_9EURO|nr:uncharacterized protein PV07_00033 [Cladophialophora immunda]KIW33162.1 hypothetical protein PV07_00033 [Cladophialophora immunda]